MGNRNIYIYDIETFKEVFTYVGLNIDTEEIVKYVVYKDLNQFNEFIIHLESIKGHIGFNNISFDYPIIHYILLNYAKWIDIYDAKDIIDLIYKKAQELIESQNFGFDKFSGVKEKEWLIPQLDLFKLWHFNNAARQTSLKALEISMNYPNVMESSIHHSKENLTLEEVKDVLEYNENDVLATYEFYKLSRNKLDLRNDLNNKYNLNCSNYSDSKIGESLVLKLYCDKTEFNPWDIKKLRTKRESIKLSDCIFDYIKFKTKEFNKLLNDLNSKTITETKDSIKESVLFKGAKYIYGTGGTHMCCKTGIYEPNKDELIMSLDVASLYPSIAVVNKLYPEHLGEEFCEVYEDILNQRIQAKKVKNMTLSDGFKLSLNSVYGKSNDTYSFLYDPLYTMKTTLNGQLMLTMLCEDLALAGFQILMVNTDGLECIIPKNKLEIYYAICKRWELLTKLTLEYVNYTKMIIGDINNYISISSKGKIKYKGRFVIDKELHQDNSFKIVPIALSEFFIKGIEPEITIKNHKNIYDFSGRQKFKGQDFGVTHSLKYDSKQLPYDEIIKQQKNTRYYISNKGSTFIKHYKKGTTEVINKDYQVTIFNKYVDKSDYDINYDFYIKQCYREINQIIDKQLNLF